MEKDINLVKIWENTTWGAAFVSDAINARREDPKADLTKHLGEALMLLDKATGEIQQILAASYLNRRS